MLKTNVCWTFIDIDALNYISYKIDQGLWSFLWCVNDFFFFLYFEVILISYLGIKVNIKIMAKCYLEADVAHEFKNIKVLVISEFYNGIQVDHTITDSHVWMTPSCFSLQREIQEKKWVNAHHTNGEKYVNYGVSE